MKNISRELVLKGNIPNHIAIIMDGNGRWAKSRLLPRVAGHKEGINSVREITRVCGEIGVKHLTLFTFSKENWKRPRSEVNALMSLLLKTINIEVKALHKNNVKFNIIGDLKSLPNATVDGLSNGIKLTDSNTGLNLCLAINYGSRQEIIETVQTIAKKVLSKKLSINEITEKLISDLLYTRGIPDPDLLIRTSGEYRLSNFLLWQSAYTEIYMTETFWPVFREEELLNAIYNFQLRERRFGKVSSQIKNQ